MKTFGKRLISLLMILSMFVSLAVPATAEGAPQAALTNQGTRAEAAAGGAENAATPGEANTASESSVQTGTDAEETPLAKRTLNVKATSADLYDEEKEPLEQFAWTQYIWFWLKGYVPEVEDEYVEAPSVEITGRLPEDVYAKAEYILFREPDDAAEPLLYSFSITLFDGDDQVYVPENKVTVTLHSPVFRWARQQEYPLMVYADNTHDKSRVEKDERIDSSVTVWCSETVPASRVSYKIEDPDDNVVFSEQEECLGYSDDDYSLCSFHTDMQPLNLLVSAVNMGPKEEPETTAPKKAAAAPGGLKGAPGNTITVTSASELTAALNSAANGDTVLLQNNITSESPLSAAFWNNSSSCTLDLGGHTLTVGGSGFTLSDSSSASILLINGNLVSDFTAKVGTVTLGEGLTLTGDVSVTDSGVLYVDGSSVSGDISVVGGSKLYVDGGTVGGSVSSDQDGTVTIISGSVSGDVSVTNGGGLDISGGTVGGDVSATNTTTTMSGGTVSGDMTIVNQSASISGGTVSGDVNATNTTTTITGGDFGGSIRATGGSTSITGGSFQELPEELIGQNAKVLTITADDATKSFDGTPLTKDTYTYTGLETGDTLQSVTVTGTQTAVGHSANVPSDAQITRGGADVTAEYIIVYHSGTLTVTESSTERVLTVTADSAEKVYDGTALTKNTYTYTGLVAGDVIESVTVTGSQTTAGESANVPSAAVIHNADGEDITASYTISYENGALSVTPKALTITADSASKRHDGTPLTKDTYTYTDLAEGDAIESVTVTGEQTDYGESANVPSAALIRNADNQNVTASYAIEYVNGTLAVTVPTLTITADSAEKVYDGTPLTKDTYTYTGLEEGEVLQSVTVTGAQTTAGESANIPSDAIVVNADGEDITASFTINYVNGALSVTPKALTITADSASKRYDGTALTVETYTTDTDLAEGDAIESIAVSVTDDQGAPAEALTGGTYVSVPSAAAILNANTEDVTNSYDISYVNGTLTVIQPSITITADSAEKTYDGEPLTKNSYTHTALYEGDVIKSVTVTGEQTNAGESANVPSEAVIFDADGADVTGSYIFTYEDGTLTVKPAPVTLSGIKTCRNYTGEVMSVSGFTCSVPGLSFPGVSAEASGAGAEEGVEYTVSFTGVVLNETRDSTRNYVVTEAVEGRLLVAKLLETAPDITEEHPTGFEGNLAYYKVIVNPYGLTMNGGEPVTLKDTLIEKTATNGYTTQSIDYSSVAPTPAAGVSFDYSGYTGTFLIPDATPLTITYTARVLANAGQTVKFGSTDVLGLPDGSNFDQWAAVGLDREKLITPTGSDITGEGGKYTVQIYAYETGHLETGLQGATFRLLDNNQRPISYTKGANAGEQVTFTTGADGYVTVELEQDRDGVTIHKNTVYYLEMTETPIAVSGTGADATYRYFQKDDTLYSFLITDNAEYSLGDSGIYTYFNDDVLKVRCYPEAVGINVTARFAGNYTPTDAQKNAVEFILERENTATNSWDPVEQHSFAEFSYGSLRLDTGSTGWKARDYGATYRVRVLNAEIEGLYLNITPAVSSQANGHTVSDETNEFLVDPDHEAYSFSLIFTIEYAHHTLTFYALDEDIGTLLSGMEISTFMALDDQGTVVDTYTTGADGTTFIERTGDYQSNVLYYAVETAAPSGYLLPDEPVKTYFYFSENSTLVPPGLPSGTAALDLSKTYSTIALSNVRDKINLPVVLAWGLTGAGTWPDEVDHVVVALYKSVDGAEPTPVAGKTVPLTAAKNFDNSVFHDLDMLENGKTVTYSLVETVYGDAAETQDLTSHYAMSENVSGSGWHVLRNQEAVSITVQKSWRDLNGAAAAAPTGTSSVVFDLYRTTVELESSETLDRGDIQSFLNSNSAVLVRSGLTLTEEDGWTQEISSLQKTDSKEKTYYYFVLERESSMPPNHEDSYTITPKAGTDLRTLTIINNETPITVIIQPQNASMVYGDPEADYSFDIEVQDPDAVVGAVNHNESNGEYWFTVTRAGVIKTISFTLSRNGGESVGSYTLTPLGSSAQGDYRVLYRTGTLTINRAPVTVTAGATKVYGNEDPKLVAVTGMKNGENAAALIRYDLYREPGEDVNAGPYGIWVSGETLQGNYAVTYVNGYLTVTPAQAIVRTNTLTKYYGETEPDLTVTVTGLKAYDSESVIAYDLTRDPGEDVGEYIITATGEADQGNYTVSFEPGKLTIVPAPLNVMVENKEIIYGDAQPDWDVWLDGLQRDDANYTLVTTMGESGTTYTYTLPGENKTLVFTLSSNISADVGEYDINFTGSAAQGNYALNYESATLTIVPAQLTVTPDDTVRNVNDPDPILTATIDGWKNEDGDEGNFTLVSTESDGVTTCTYTLRGGKTLTFTLQRVPGTAVGDYTISSAGAPNQGNYEINYDMGIFSILSVYGIQISQAVTDPVDASARPEFQYRAEVDLAGTGLTGLVGFDRVGDTGLIFERSFTLKGDKAKETLSIPVGAKLTVSQVAANSDYETAMTLDGDPYENGGQLSCAIDHVDNFYYIGFEQSRICLPATAMAAVGQTEEGAEAVSPSAYIGIPAGTLAVDGSLAQTLQTASGYVLPVDKYFEFDHAKLVDVDGNLISGGEQVVSLRYDAGSEGGSNTKWRFENADGDEYPVPTGAVLRLYYYPKYICQIWPEGQSEPEKFYTLNAALQYMQTNSMPEAEVEMLRDNFVMPAADVLTIPAGYSITLKKATTGFEGSGTTAAISRSVGLTGNMFVNNGVLILDDVILDGNSGSVTHCDAMVRSAGDLTVGANATVRNAHGVTGGAIAVTGGTATLAGTITGNHATNGGAVHMTGGSLTVTGGTISGNTASSGGVVFLTGGSVSFTGGSVTGNSASYGGAVYMEGGSVSVSDSGSVSGNTAAVSGGMLFATGGNVTVSGGSVTNNTATSGNGGAICYGGPGTVTVSGGAVTGNSALNGNGGAIYQSSGTVNLSGTINGANTAKNGSAIFVKAGIANFNACTIQDNKTPDNGSTPTGGAVGVDAEARLYFSGNTVIKDNKNKKNIKANVYLDEDSDAIINVPSAGLGGSANIGVFVADSVRPTRGEMCCSFGAYVSTSNLSKISNDRGTYSVYSSENKLYWGKAIKFTVRYLADGFPTSSTSGTSLLSEKSYYPKSSTNQIYDLVTALYNEYADLQKAIKAGYVYANAYANAYVSFDKHITSIDWENNRWSFKHNETEVTNSSASVQFTIFYSDASYLNITNNSEYPLTISALSVFSKDALEDQFGYVTAINNVNLSTLLPIVECDFYDADTDEFTVPAGGTIKLLFPGAKGKAWNLDGAFDFGDAQNPAVQYTLKGGTAQTLTGSAVSLSDNLLSNATGIYEILFGEPTIICKVGTKPFSSLTKAMAYIQSDEYDSTTATIEMLIDYQQPKNDILEVPEGYNITLTTAEPMPENPVAGTLYYVGEDPTRATISRSSGEVGSAVKALVNASTQVTTNADAIATSLTVTNLVFDGKALGQGGEGGAINTANVDVKISGCAFKGYTAARGGAIFTKWGRLEVRNCSFDKCRVFATEDKTGGGGVWTTAQVLTVDNCTFTDCYGQGQAQGSAVFHNIRNDGAVVNPSDSQKFPTGFSRASETYISNCRFKNCTANGSGGTIESDAVKVEISNCYFNGSQTLKSGGSGGAINIYTNDSKNIPTTASVKLSGCTFVDCSVPNSSDKTGGGVIRTLSPILIIENSTFTNASAKTVGGVIHMTNSGSSIQITGCAFENCSAGTSSGAVYAHAKTVEITNSTFKDCTAPSYGCVYQDIEDSGSSLTVTNSSFENCSSTNSAGGALYTKAKTLSVSGKFAGRTHAYYNENMVLNTQTYSAKDFTFKSCTAAQDGGAVYHGSGTSDTLTNCVFDGCTSDVKGGGAYLAASTVSVTGGEAKNCRAVSGGGGLYISPSTAAISGCSFSGDWVTASDGKGGALFINQGTVSLDGGTISNCQATYGGGVYQSTNGTLTMGSTAGPEITGCYAVYGGGIYHSKALNANAGTITNCTATVGGGIYSAGDLSMPDSGSDMQISACYARDVTLKDDGTRTAASSFSAENLGGGVYKSAGSFTTSSPKAKITACQAYDGGGVYVAGGTFTHRGGSVDHNEAQNCGGGVYYGGGTFSLSGGVADILVCDNTADRGAGIFVADGKTMTANVWGTSESGISYAFVVTGNHARSAGGGVAVGGASAVLKFQGNGRVKDNTQGSENERSNVYLDQNSNTVIQTGGWVNSASYIGVHVSDEQMDAHGLPGKPFGTRDADSTALTVFRNDRDPYHPYYYGVRGSANKEIVWSSFVCKITGYNPTTDKWEMLYTAPTDTPADGLPAVYAKLEGTDTGSAFGTLNVSDTPSLYLAGSESKYSNTAGYRIEMLVQDYALPSQISLSNSKTITLTTADREADECGFKYEGLQNHPYATITRSATFGSMFTCSSGSLTFTDIIIDGGANNGVDANNKGGIVFLNGATTVTVGSNATLRNSHVASQQNGAGVRVENGNAKLILKDGGLITNCTGSEFGGGVSVKYGTFEMNGGTISHCSAANGGAVALDATMRMSGGTITENSATTEGGGIFPGNNNARIYFSGNAVVIGNTLEDGTACNLQLSGQRASDVRLKIINAAGLTDGANIGVYTAGAETSGTMYYAHGRENMAFGTWTSDSHLYCFSNDRNGLVGGRVSTSDKSVYWLGRPMIVVNMSVVSDWSADQTKNFTFTVQLDGFQDYVTSAELLTYDFNSSGRRTFQIKSGEYREISLPVSLLGNANYTVTETVDADYFTTTVENRRPSGENEPAAGTSISGRLGENVQSGDLQSTSTSKLYFVNTRKTGSVSISKTVDSLDSDDFVKDFSYVLTLEDLTIGKVTEDAPDGMDYDCDVENADGSTTAGTVTFKDGVANFTIQHGQTLTVNSLPLGIGFTVEEKLTSASDQKFFQVRVGKNGAATEPFTTASGKIGVLNSVEYNNIKLEVVCKILSRTREQLYYRDGGELVEAIYFRLEDAFEQINNGGLRTADGRTASGTLRIEMLVPSYTMTGPATLDANKTVVLSTALESDDKHPYRRNEGDSATATVERGFTDGSMIASSGNLTLDNITLDGKRGDYTSTGNGGIIAMGANTRLTVNSGATLKNANVGDYDGGAIWMDEDGNLTMSGVITNCSGGNGGAIYVSDGLRSFTVTGTVTGNTASGDGGAIYAGVGGISNVNLTLTGATITGNSASGDGGAVYSLVSVTARNATTGETPPALNVSGNSAGGSGGGIYMGAIEAVPATETSEAVEAFQPSFTLSSGAITGNSARNGGALVVQGVTSISGGSVTDNTASDCGGAIYTTETANVTIRGNSTVFSGNEAALGGVVYDQGAVTMSGGSMTGNTATTAGGAIYISGDHSFTMSNGSITGNVSPEGAVSSDGSATLNFSGSAVIHENISYNDPEYPDQGSYANDVYLNVNSTTMINTPGLGSGADIGIYVVNGMDNNILYEHGIANCNFGTYTGTDPAHSGLERFFNDRDPELRGVDGKLEQDEVSGVYYVMWRGKDLHLLVYCFDVQTYSAQEAEAVENLYLEGTPRKDGDNYLPVEFRVKIDAEGELLKDDKGFVIKTTDDDPASASVAGASPIEGATFRLINVTDPDHPIDVWDGVSSSEGKVTIPWSKIEEFQGNYATFVQQNKYELRQDTTSDDCVMPGGYWKIEVARDGTVTWASVKEDGEPNRVKDIARVTASADSDITLDDNFVLYNDRHPKLIFNANGGMLHSDDKAEGEEVKITVIEDASQDYTITEVNPTWNDTKFLDWTDVKNPSDTDPDVNHYDRSDTIPAARFARTSDFDDVILYAQWETIVCKITDRDDTLLYYRLDPNNSDSYVPCIFHTLEEAVKVFNENTRFYTYTGARSPYPARKIKMLVDTYEMTQQLVVNRSKTMVITTAERGTPSDPHDLYHYFGDTWPCTLNRGFDSVSMIRNLFSLTLTNIILDGGANQVSEDAEGNQILDAEGNPVPRWNVSANGGIVNVDGDYAILSVTDGATLRNSSTSGKGGAIYLTKNSTIGLNVMGGSISSNSAGLGGGIYLEPSTTMNISGRPYFGGSGVNGDGSLNTGSGNFATGAALPADAKNGGKTYTRARQDIYIAGYAGDDVDAASLYVDGDIGSGSGTIWVWAAESPHYKTLRQFAKYSADVTNTAITLAAFRDARADVDTGADQVGQYLYGVTRTDDPDGDNVYWYGIDGSAHVMLVKVLASGASPYKALPERTFTVYADSEMSKVAKGIQLDKNGAEKEIELKDLTSGNGGAFFIGELSYGDYYVKEWNNGTYKGYFQITVDEGGVVKITDPNTRPKTTEPVKTVTINP